MLQYSTKLLSVIKELWRTQGFLISNRNITAGPIVYTVISEADKAAEVLKVESGWASGCLDPLKHALWSSILHNTPNSFSYAPLLLIHKTGSTLLY